MPHLHHAGLWTSRLLFSRWFSPLPPLVFLRGWLFLRSSALKITSARRAFSFLLGLFFIWVAMASPIAALDHELLTVHMLQHLLLMTFAPLLIWLGSPIRPLLHGLPHAF